MRQEASVASARRRCSRPTCSAPMPTANVKYCRDAQARRAPHGAKRLPDVSDEVLEPARPARVARGLFTCSTPPSSTRARRRALVGTCRRGSNAAVAASTWKRNSLSRSRSSTVRPKSSPEPCHVDVPGVGSQLRWTDCFPFGDFCLELAPALGTSADTNFHGLAAGGPCRAARPSSTPCVLEAMEGRIRAIPAAR